MWVSLFSFFCQGHVGKIMKKILSGKKIEFHKFKLNTFFFFLERGIFIQLDR